MKNIVQSVDGVLYKSIPDANVYTPDQYAAGWKIKE